MTEDLWRSRARIVAYVDLIFAAFAVVMAIIAIIGLSAATAASKSGLDPEQENAANVLLVVAWVAVVVTGILIAIQVWLSIRLIHATEIECDPTQALQNSRNWRNFNVVLVVITLCINMFAMSSFYYGAIRFIVRVGFLYVVHRFIEELEARMLTSRGSGNPPVYNMA